MNLHKIKIKTKSIMKENIKDLAVKFIKNFLSTIRIKSAFLMNTAEGRITNSSTNKFLTKITELINI